MRWLASRRLLCNIRICSGCGNLCQLQNYQHGLDGKRWSCEPCGYRKSIRDGSFFSRSHMSLKKIVLMVYCWAQDMPQDVTMREAEVDGNHTVINWFNLCREDAGRYLDMKFTELGGFDDDGTPIIVEIDETKYFHRKYHRGQWTAGHWVFGGVERGSGRCFLAVVPNRTAAILEPLILQHILPGTQIISDGWASYRNLSTLAQGIYKHV